MHVTVGRIGLGRKLQHTRAQLQTIIDALPSMVGYWDSHLRNQFANKAYARFFNCEPKALAGRHIRELLGDKLFEAADFEGANEIADRLKKEIQATKPYLFAQEQGIPQTPQLVQTRRLSSSTGLLCARKADSSSSARATPAQGRPVRA